MSETVKRMTKYAASNAFKARNPHFFNNTHQSMVEPSKPLISQPKAKLGHYTNGLSDRFKEIWKLLKGPRLEEEFRFHASRKWRVDFCHLSSRTCIELEGNIYSKRGGHTSLTGILRDIEKYNELVYGNFRLIRLYRESSNHTECAVNVANITRLIRFLERSS